MNNLFSLLRSLLVIILLPNIGFSQNDSIPKRPFFYDYKDSPYDFPPKVTERTLGIVTEAQIWNHFFISLGLSIEQNSAYRRGVSSGSSYGLYMEYNPFTQSYGPKVSFRQYALVFAYKINGIYYITKGKNAPAL